MKTVYAVHPDDFSSYGTSKIRDRFLLEGLAVKGKANLVYTNYDRMIAGVVYPTDGLLVLQNDPELRSEFFLQRREIGIINVAGSGSIKADGITYPLDKLDCLYLGLGTLDVEFTSKSVDEPAVFFVLSSPAHKNYPSTLFTRHDAMVAEMGSTETANERRIYKYIHKDGIQSCQLLMGLTILNNGSIWNTMPPHTHNRRMEAYFYFDVEPEHRVFHYMGTPQETRHILVGNYEAVISPPWSIHAGSGTKSYGFIWGMAGENMEFTDMDAVQIKDIR